MRSYKDFKYPLSHPMHIAQAAVRNLWLRLLNLKLEDAIREVDVTLLPQTQCCESALVLNVDPDPTFNLRADPDVGTGKTYLQKSFERLEFKFIC
jgi:hypothetical protein